MPPHAEAPHDMIFGLLALQTGLVSPSDLVQAFSAWTQSKDRHLSDILVEQSALKDDERAILAALAEMHLARHAGDPEATLSAVRSFEIERTAGADDTRAVRDAFEGAGEPTQACDPDETAEFPTRPGPGAYGRYVRGPIHAEGGLGAIYRAVDTELNRVVALKEIKERLADSRGYRAQFEREARLTARLEHPGIVTVHGFGRQGNGRPYYAMRLLRGETLRTAIARLHGEVPGPAHPEAPAPTLRGLVGRFVAICEAIRYAHSQGVLHRDLKPDNILVGGFGETIVLDWGLAKPFAEADAPDNGSPPAPDDDDAMTRDGDVKGTMRYTSPEQAEPRPDRIGPRSDVYGLGAILYAILTGKSPIHEPGLTVREVRDRAVAGAIARPRALNPNAPPALEAVCLKAMSLDPDARYDSPRALADDVERWLADEPVSAYRDPALTRLARWSRKHRPLVASAAVLLVSTLVALAADDIRVQAKNVEIAQALGDSRKHLAESDRYFALARRGTNDLFQRVAEDLASKAGTGEVRRALAARVVDDFRAFLLARPDDLDLRADAASAFREAANVGRYTGQADTPRPLYDEAITLYRGLRSEAPDDESHLLLLALTHIDLGEFHRVNGRPRDAEPAYLEAITLVDPRAIGPKPAPRYERIKAIALLDLAQAKADAGDFAGARTAIDPAIQTLANLRPTNPPSYIDAVLLAEARKIRALIRREVGDLDGADADLDAALTILRPLPIRDADVRLSLGSALADTAEALAARANRADVRLARAEEAVKVLTPLVQPSSDIPFHVAAMAGAYHNAADARLAVGRVTEARADALKARALADWLLKSRDLPEYRSLLAATLDTLGRVAAAEKKHDEATRTLNDALAHHEAARKAGRAPSIEDRRIAANRALIERLGAPAVAGAP